MTDRTLVELRCSAIVFRDDRLLLLRRRRDGAEDWVLPGGHPRPREGAAACVECEVLEETGIRIQSPRVAFVRFGDQRPGWRSAPDRGRVPGR